MPGGGGAAPGPAGGVEHLKIEDDMVGGKRKHDRARIAPLGEDIVARLIGQWLSDDLGQPLVIENRPGADGNIATEAVVRAPAEGYTLLLVNSSNVTNTTFYEKLNFAFIRDIAPVASIVSVPLVMEVNTSFPVNSVPEFIAYAKANPGKVNFASSGSGGLLHLAGELFKMMAGVEMIHVPYRGTAPALGGEKHAGGPTREKANVIILRDF